MKNRIIRLLSFLVLAGCAQVTSLNLRKHQFGKLPTKIVWIQVAGLSEDHLALLKYSYPSANSKTALEDSLCIGKAWEYNLYDIRPDAKSGFMSQMTGKENIKNSCEDYSLKPIWKYVTEKGYKAGVFEGEVSAQESILAANECSRPDFLDGLRIWKMQKAGSKNSNFFHAEETTEFEANKIYYDRSCLSGECFSTLSGNVSRVYESFSRNTSNYLFIVRNFKYNKFMSSGKVVSAKEELSQINKIVSYFQNIAGQRSDFLLLVTSSGAKHVSFPAKGKEWGAFERSGKNFSAKKSNLMSSVFVNGARAENFCGVYKQADIMPRIFSGAKQQGLELTIINPFKD